MFEYTLATEGLPENPEMTEIGDTELRRTIKRPYRCIHSMNGEFDSPDDESHDEGMSRPESSQADTGSEFPEPIAR